MKAGELGKEIGKTAMEVGRIRSKILPDSGPDMTEGEVNAIKSYLDIKTHPDQIEVFCFQADPRFPNLVEATDKTRLKRYTVQIPQGFQPNQFLGKFIKVQQREYAPDMFVYEYNPYKQDD
jgi:hypothetical protein